MWNENTILLMTKYKRENPSEQIQTDLITTNWQTLIILKKSLQSASIFFKVYAPDLDDSSYDYFEYITETWFVQRLSTD